MHLKSLLEEEGFLYFVHNDHFGMLKTGPNITLFNEKTILVSEEHVEQASELISDYLKRAKSDTTESEYSLIDKIRMIVETSLFSWFIPGKK